MQTETIAFTNSRGRRLAARLDRPDGAAHGFALFAHCFTCDKTSKAAVRISRELAALGLMTLRFDFTGLGESEGELTGFSSDVQDLLDAAAFMAGRGMAPALLVGHSLGGTAVLAAAGDIGSAKAVAVIGAPAEPAHVLRQLGADLAAIERDGAAEVRIGGRPFTVRRDFVDDARMHDLKARIAGLHRALLILHSPIDNIVGVENATEIFLAARHPKSFVSLDDADHLLTRNADADYAAGVIAAWASRYVGAAAGAQPPAEPSVDGVLVEETGAGKFQVEVRIRSTRLVADEPVDVGGLGSGPSPYELVSAGLGACTAMTVRLYAERKGWPLKRTRVVVSHDKVDGQTPPDVFHRQIGFEGPLEPEQTARLLEIAEKCPVHRTLEAGSRVETTSLPADPPPPAAVEAQADEHFREMDEVCKEAGAA